MTDIRLDLTQSIVDAKVDPKRPYSPTMLSIEKNGMTICLDLTDEQLSDIGYAIQKHLERTRAHEYPDQQMIHHQEHIEAIERKVS